MSRGNITKTAIPPPGGFFVLISNRKIYMQTINKFYLQQAVYRIEVGGEEVALLLDYAGNKYYVIGGESKRVGEIAELLLAKKHNINFAYKFDGKIEPADAKAMAGKGDTL